MLRYVTLLNYFLDTQAKALEIYMQYSEDQPFDDYTNLSFYTDRLNELEKLINIQLEFEPFSSIIPKTNLKQHLGYAKSGLLKSKKYHLIDSNIMDILNNDLSTIREALSVYLIKESEKAQPFPQQVNCAEIPLTKEKPFKIFISHSTKNEKYVKAFVELLESFGLKTDDIFCSSLPPYTIPLGENIYEYLRKQFTDYSLHLILILSKDYYNSPASLNEMGAGWVFQTKSTALLLPDFDFSDIKGAIDTQRIGIKLDNDDLLKPRLRELRNQLVESFKLYKVDEDKWDRYVNKFLEEIHRLQTDK